MARFLIGWEFGGGHGHAVNMVALGRALMTRGHDVILVARDNSVIWPVVRDAGMPVLTSPAFAGIGMALTGGKPFQARRFSDVLAVFGYGEPSLLEPQVRAWDALLDVVRPDVVVGEFAPALALAARGRVPSLAFGIGYCLPCLQGGQFPLLNEHATALITEYRLRESIATVMQALRREVPADPLDALLGDEQLMISMDEIDPYRAARSQPALGPLASMPALAPAPAEDYALVYVPAEHPHITALMQGLAGLAMKGIAYIRSAQPPLLDLVRQTGLEISTVPIDLEAYMPRATVMLHHGGPGTVQRCLAAGVPQVVAPMYLEQRLVTQALVELGVGSGLAEPGRLRGAAELLRHAGRDAVMRSKARALAEIVQAKYPVGSLERVADACVARIN